MCDIIKELRIRNVTYWTGYRPICELHTAFYLLKILFQHPVERCVVVAVLLS